MKVQELKYCCHPALSEIGSAGYKHYLNRLDHLWVAHFEVEVVYLPFCLYLKEI